MLKYEREWYYPVKVSTVKGRIPLGPNNYLIAKIGSFLDTSVATSPTLESCTKRDSHANMVVLGRNYFLFDGFHGLISDVDPFDTSIVTSKKAPIVDDSVSYTCTYTHETYLMI